jgi:hypothetical protein
VVGVDGDVDARRKPAERLVGGVVDCFLDDVRGSLVRVYMPGRSLTGWSP